MVRDNLQRIIVWPFPSGTPEVIASSAQGGFSSSFSRPGISHDGKAVGFVGDRGAGPGVFVSVEVVGGVGRTLVKIAGEGDAFGGFSDAQRVSVQTDASAGGQPIVRCVFYATRAGVTGLYATSAYVYSPLKGPNLPAPRVSEPRLVQALSAPLAGSTITGLTLHDGLNRCGQVAYVANLANGGRAVVRSTPVTPAQSVRLRVSAKRVRSPAGVIHPAWTTDNTRQVVEQAAVILQQSGIDLSLVGIDDVTDPLPAAGALWSTQVANVPALEQAASQTNADAYRWRNDAINIYFVHQITDSTGSNVGYCSFPANAQYGLAPDSQEIVLMAPEASVADSALTLAHELGHYLNLLHPHEAPVTAPSTWPSWPTGVTTPAAVPEGACTEGDHVHDTHPDPYDLEVAATFGAVLQSWYPAGTPENSAVTNNVMGYWSGMPGVLTDGQAARMHEALALFRQHVVDPEASTVTVLGPGRAEGAAAQPQSSIGLTPPGQSAPFELWVASAPNAQGLLFLVNGTAAMPLALGSDLLWLPITTPLSSGLPFATNASGLWTLPLAPLPPGLGGLTIRMQALLTSGTVPAPLSSATLLTIL